MPILSPKKGTKRVFSLLRKTQGGFGVIYFFNKLPKIVSVKTALFIKLFYFIIIPVLNYLEFKAIYVFIIFIYIKHF